MGKRVDSLNARRVASQLAFVYSEGGKNRGSHLSALAKEIMDKHKSEAVAFSSKAAFYSILFIAFSALVPVLFQAFLIGGSLFFRMDILPLHALAIIVILFPAVDALILAFLRHKTPVFLK